MFQQTSHRHTSPSRTQCLPRTAQPRPHSEACSCKEPGTLQWKISDINHDKYHNSYGVGSGFPLDSDDPGLESVEYGLADPPMIIGFCFS